VNYLGQSLESDNHLGLLLLPEYVKLLSDVKRAIHAPANKSLLILDIGANIGQFAATARRLFGATVYSVEPNPACWPYLVSNGADSDHWKLIRKAASSTSAVVTLHYVSGKSAQGSFSRANASENLITHAQEISVEVESGPITLLELGLDNHPTTVFDLVKIDVEGFELDALRGIKGISFNHLLIELDPNRDNGFTERDIHEVANKELHLTLKKIFVDRPSNDVGPQNVLFCVEN
jgi:FkbM family methyltransferase